MELINYLSEAEEYFNLGIRTLQKEDEIRIENYLAANLSKIDFRDGLSWRFREYNYNLAIAFLKKAIALKSDFVEARHQLANLLVACGKYEEALSHYIKVVEQPWFPESALLNLAVTYEKLGERTLSDSLYQQVITLGKFPVSLLAKVFKGNYQEFYELLSNFPKTLSIPKGNQNHINQHFRCNFCGDINFSLFKNNKLVKCNSCGLISVAHIPERTDLELKYNEQYFAPFIEKAEYLLNLWKTYLNREQRIMPTGKQFAIVFNWLASLGFEDYEHNLQLPKRSLDIGCATCGLLAEMIGRGWEAYGVEISHYATAFAKKMGFNVFCGTLEEARYPNEFFDFITITHTLEHLPNPNETLAEVYRITKPKGKLLIRTPNKDSLPVIIAGEEWFSDPDHLYFFGEQTLKKMLEKNGFRIVGEKKYVGIDIETYRNKWDELELNDLIRAKINDLELGDVILVYAEKQ